MSDKAKDRVDSDSDSDADFFTIKRAPISKLAGEIHLQLQLIPAPTAPIVMRSSSPDYESYDSDDSDADAKKNRRKRKRSKSNKPAPQPSWLLDVSLASKKGRESSRSTDREASKSRPPVAEIEIPEEEDEEEKERRKRERILAAITPPPMLSDEVKEALRAQVDETLPMEVLDDEDEEEISGPSRPRQKSVEATFEPDEKVNISFNMVADPDRRAAGVSERALRQYEKKWTTYVNRRDPLSRMVADLAHRLNRDASDIILEYKGAKVPLSFTPLRLGIQPDVEVPMLGYESAIYEKIQQQKEARRLRQLAEENGEEEADNGGGDEPEPEAAPEAEAEDEPEPEETEKRTVLRLRGVWGDKVLRVADNVSARLLVTHYCKKTDHVGQEDEVRLEFDGERVDMDSSVGDMGVEDRDIIDVICN